jgi:hypothetical protein
MTESQQRRLTAFTTEQQLGVLHYLHTYISVCPVNKHSTAVTSRKEETEAISPASLAWT